MIKCFTGYDGRRAARDPSLGFQRSVLRAEFPSSRNGSTTTMPTRLVSSSFGPRSDAVVRLLDVFVIQVCFVLYVPDFGPMQYKIYVLMLVDMFILSHVMLSQFPDFGLMQGTRSQSVPDFGPMQFSGFGPMQWARPNMCYMLLYGMWYFGGAH